MAACQTKYANMNRFKILTINLKPKPHRTANVQLRNRTKLHIDIKSATSVLRVHRFVVIFNVHVYDALAAPFQFNRCSHSRLHGIGGNGSDIKRDIFRAETHIHTF